MKNLLLILCSFYFLNCNAEGCNLPRVTINYNGPQSFDQIDDIGTVYFPLYTNYTLHIYGSMPCMNIIKKLKLYKDDVLLLTIDTSCYYHPIALKSVPGNYKLIVDFDTQRFYPRYCEWTYKVVENPTAISEQGFKSNLVSVQPNPASDYIRIITTEAQLTKATLCDALGAVVASIDQPAQNFELPLQDLPQGIYFLHLAILGEQTVIKKIVIQ